MKLGDKVKYNNDFYYIIKINNNYCDLSTVYSGNYEIDIRSKNSVTGVDISEVENINGTD